MDEQQLQAIRKRWVGKEVSVDGITVSYALIDIAALLAEVRRLQLAEKVCKLMQKNRGGHYCVVSKCDNCHTEEVGNAGEVCWQCIEKALKEWEAAE